VFESIVKECLYNRLTKFNLINNSQHGFVKNRSCVSNLLEFLKFVCNNVDDGNRVTSYIPASLQVKTDLNR